jgi:hypothetical protein
VVRWLRVHRRYKKWVDAMRMGKKITPEEKKESWEDMREREKRR